MKKLNNETALATINVMNMLVTKRNRCAIEIPIEVRTTLQRINKPSSPTRTVVTTGFTSYAFGLVEKSNKPSVPNSSGRTNTADSITGTRDQPRIPYVSFKEPLPPASLANP